jgi:hypothetical protein
VLNIGALGRVLVRRYVVFGGHDTRIGRASRRFLGLVP